MTAPYMTLLRKFPKFAKTMLRDAEQTVCFAELELSAAKLKLRIVKSAIAICARETHAAGSRNKATLKAHLSNPLKHTNRASRPSASRGYPLN